MSDCTDLYYFCVGFSYVSIKQIINRNLFLRQSYYSKKVNFIHFVLVQSSKQERGGIYVKRMNV